MRKLVLSTVVAAAVLAPSAAQAGPGPTEEPVYCGPGMTQVGVTCVPQDPEQTEQEAAWESLVFGGLLVVYAVGTAIVGV